MREFDLRAEIDRQLSVCNACRYCEGYCAVFPAAELRTGFDDGAVTYLANLCHDCRNCYDACMFAPPHEFAVNIPKVLAEARVRTYERYSRPNVLARQLRSGWIAPVAIGLLALGTIAALGGPSNLVTRHIGPGAFYAEVPYLALVVPALVLSLCGLFVILAGALEFARDIGLPRGSLSNWAAIGRATAQALSLQYLKGGGAGCYYPRERGSSARRRLHGCVVWGVLAAMVSTTLAAIEQDLLHVLPPYDIVSAPVLFGIAGGILMVVGCTGLLVLKPQSDPIPTSDRMKAMDYAFLVSLNLAAITGLLTLVLRSSSLMGLVFSIHLAVLAGLFVTAPYGKLVHFVYRFLALVKNAEEGSLERS